MRAKDDAIAAERLVEQTQERASKQAQERAQERAPKQAEEQAQERTPGRAAAIPDQGQRPLLLVDIDGVISLFGPGRDERPRGSFHWIDGMPHFLSSEAAEHLLALEPSFELVWASGWEERADEYLPHLLGLPKLPHLRFERAVGRTNAHWKLDAIDAHSGRRPLAWVDDAFNDACHAWAAERSAPTLLVQTEPASGITQREVKLLRSWQRSLARA